MDGHATALASPPAASFPDKPARSEYSEEGAPGESTETAPPPENFVVDPPSAAIHLPCSGRRPADAVVHADPLGSFAERRPGRSVQRRRRRSSISASSSSAGLTSTRNNRIGDRSTLTRSASFELRRRSFALFTPPLGDYQGSVQGNRSAGKKLMMEDRKQKVEELNKLFAMDMDALPEELRAVYMAMRKGLIDFFINNPI
ncbi:uncharacterized protein [Zea mays]|uniref:uncharacterized protein isoform X1 n=1 Tax=Zea mays TaxID=4577 RepID=UPI0004DE7BD9|nr:uncharacterized protein LOC103643392 isoform X1 [Zea mays]|eukprot:XP_008664785.1 uncharacterized protein LOC103643392 isoform X1 [Zea mays]